MSKIQEFIAATPDENVNQDDIAMVIGFVLNLEYERMKKREDPARITMKRNTAPHSHWGIMSRLRQMPTRSFRG